MKNPITALKEKRQEEQNRRTLKLFLTGFAMGSADIVPGVSGGTIAFVLGVYEELIDSIKIVTSDTIKFILKLDIKKAIKSVPWFFLVPLGLGLITAVLTMARILEYVLITYPQQTWGFFFGLVTASIFIVGKRVTKWNFSVFAALVLSAIFAFFLVGMVPQQTPATLPAFFVAGMIAICAMILPGVSGSFLLIMLGKYSQVLGAVNDANFVILLTVMAGAVFGLALFSRIISWAFKNYHNIMIAMLTGFMLGSLRKLWPWKEFTGADLEHAVDIKNILPAEITTEVLITILLAVIGAGLIILVDKVQNAKK